MAKKGSDRSGKVHVDAYDRGTGPVHSYDRNRPGQGVAGGGPSGHGGGQRDGDHARALRELHASQVFQPGLSHQDQVQRERDAMRNVAETNKVASRKAHEYHRDPGPAPRNVLGSRPAGARNAGLPGLLSRPGYGPLRPGSVAAAGRDRLNFDAGLRAPIVEREDDAAKVVRMRREDEQVVNRMHDSSLQKRFRGAELATERAMYESPGTLTVHHLMGPKGPNQVAVLIDHNGHVRRVPARLLGDDPSPGAVYTNSLGKTQGDVDQHVKRAAAARGLLPVRMLDDGRDSDAAHAGEDRDEDREPERMQRPAPPRGDDEIPDR
jgi:hypothetical protein